DLDNYYTAYPELTISGGKDAFIRIHWAEALFEHLDPRGTGWSPKGNRDVIEGKTFAGIGDEFISDGQPGRTYSTLWWESGRYLEVRVVTKDQPLRIDALR